MIRKININLRFEVDVCGDAPDEVLLDEIENYLMSSTTICVDNENLQIFGASMEITASAIEPYLPAIRSQ